MSSPPPPAPNPIFNTTYTLHRVTPLHSFPSPISAPLLAPHARTLTSHLRGDVLRNVRVRDPEDGAAPTGRLQKCAWKPIEDDYTGVEITIEYETTTYTALLLGGDETESGGFTKLPLLMVRAPKAIKDTVVEYLETSFDCVVRPMVVSGAVVRDWTALWTAVSRRGTELSVVLAPPGNTGLKTATVTLGGKDVRRMFWKGWEGLEQYCIETMGLEITKWDVKKLVCGGLVVQTGDAAKIKIFETEVDEEVEVIRRVMNGLLGIALE